MSRPRSTSRFTRFRPKRRPASGPLRCPKCGSPAEQLVACRAPGIDNAVVVECVAGCPPFAVTPPNLIPRDHRGQLPGRLPEEFAK